MKKLQVASIVVFGMAFVGFILWRFFVPFPDWLARTAGVLMLVSIFTTVFSTVRISAVKK